jgi:hypothetical protein
MKLRIQTQDRDTKYNHKFTKWIFLDQIYLRKAHLLALLQITQLSIELNHFPTALFLKSYLVDRFTYPNSPKPFLEY